MEPGTYVAAQKKRADCVNGTQAEAAQGTIHDEELCTQCRQGLTAYGSYHSLWLLLLDVYEKSSPVSSHVDIKHKHDSHTNTHTHREREREKGTAAVCH